MDNRDDLQTILADIKSQISSFDQKSGILLSAIGIVYALLLDFSLVFSNEWFINGEPFAKTTAIVFFFLMMGFGMLSIVLFILAIVPRRRKKDAEKHPNYYGDVARMNEKEFSKAMNSFERKDEILKKQIIVNAVICNKKHHLITAGIITLIPYALSIIGLLISIMIMIE